MAGLLNDPHAGVCDSSATDFAMDTGADVDEEFLSQSAPSGNALEPSRSSRLARKAESARQARLRHKQYVTELQGQVQALQTRLDAAQMGAASAAQAMNELTGALNASQKEQLRQWLVEAQGENHILVRVASTAVAAAAAQPAAAAQGPGVQISSPLTVGGLARGNGLSHEGSTPIAINGGGSRHSPMESDEDTFAMSRSWDDNEAARSILNLNSPNGFHPGGGAAIPGSFALPVASVAASAPSSFTFLR
uniref:BZIP domain-containing protein n=1 Tax=Calcidiscus leptoporus TaxID=127549 RepID=A0A7S0JEJ4_9EUKA|mmetsp:Transcript_52604/g.120855  ORF Transcript_52604/g.120855 Transcript_52604/m.120855 type:complete len:250 (+) Transcript_52604:123-872(+)